MASNLWVAFDWDRDGTFTGAHDDVTDRTRGGVAGEVEVAQGRDVQNVLPQIVTGTGSVTLANTDRKFSTRNASSPLSGKVRPARPFDLQRTIPTTPSPTTLGLFRGRTDDAEAEPDPDRKTVTFRLVDVLQDLRGRKVPLSVGLKQGIRVGDALNALLDAVGWTAGRDIDPGVSVLPVWWEEGNDVLGAFDRLLTSEGPPAMIAIGADGTFIFHDRHHRILNTTSSTSQATFSARPPAEPVLARGFRLSEAWSGIVNDVSVAADVWQVLPLEVVWSSDETYQLTQLVGGVTNIPITATDPFTSPQPLIAGVDYVQTSGPALTSAAVWSVASQIGPSTVLRFVNPGPTPAVISAVRLRARPIRVVKRAEATASDTASQTAYGVRSLPGSDSIGPWCSEYDLQAIATQIVTDRAQPRGVATARVVVGRNAAGTVPASNLRATATLARKLSDRVTLKVPDESLSADFYVERIAHELRGEDDHTVTLTCEEVPATIAPTGSTVFRFDTAGQGFDQGLFGR